MWCYPAKDADPAAAVMVNEKVILLGSVGNWTACETCAALIETRDKNGLLERSIETAEVLEDMPLEVVELLTKKIHAAFWENRCGERRKMLREGP